MKDLLASHRFFLMKNLLNKYVFLFLLEAIILLQIIS